MGGGTSGRHGIGIRRGIFKKLRAAFRWELEQKGTAEFLADIADEEEDAAFLAERGERPDDAIRPEWAGMYWTAWHALRNDRFYGAMGGLSPIYFAAIDRYAKRYGICGDDFDLFAEMILALDGEYVSFENERQEAEAAKNKAKD